MARADSFKLAQFSDIHCGDPRFDVELLGGIIDAINADEPDLVIVPGDLTASGYPDEFREAREYLDRLACPHVAVLIGNHDARKVGYELFEQSFGDRYRTWDFSFKIDCDTGVSQNISVIGLDSSKPDLDDGEIGRHRHRWLREHLAEADGFKLVALHHHLVSIPGTGRERNVVWDAGEVLEILAENNVDLVVAGHKHVPYVWPTAGMLIVTSGTASTWRTRGFTPPSYNMIEITPDEVIVEIRASRGDHEPRRLAYPRMPAATRRPIGTGPTGRTLDSVSPPPRNGL
ncbi:MAG: metallophosphoesterase [Actinomycetota bacterium]|nr:metallophosphoesterase [Actinomycetota bacterium]